MYLEMNPLRLFLRGLLEYHNAHCVSNHVSKRRAPLVVTFIAGVASGIGYESSNSAHCAGSKLILVISFRSSTTHEQLGSLFDKYYLFLLEQNRTNQ